MNSCGNTGYVSEAPGLSGGACFLPGTWFGRDAVEQLERPFLAHLLSGDRDRIFPGQAAQADVVPRVLEGGNQPAEGEIAKAVRLDEVRDLRDGLLVRDELVAGLHVDPEVAREPNRQTADPHVDLAGRRDWILVGELFADLHASVVHEPLIEDAVRTGEVHPLEHAMRRVVRVRQPRRFESVGPELDDLAWLQVSDEPVTGERVEYDAL